MRRYSLCPLLGRMIEDDDDGDFVLASEVRPMFDQLAEMEEALEALAEDRAMWRRVAMEYEAMIDRFFDDGR